MSALQVVSFGTFTGLAVQMRPSLKNNDKLVYSALHAIAGSYSRLSVITNHLLHFTAICHENITSLTICKEWLWKLLEIKCC